MSTETRHDYVQDLVLPTVLFAALGGMTWAVRGCSGYGGSMGCLFAGVTWGTAWWFIAREPGEIQSRRYTSGWIILALTIGIGMAGARGWMQWPSFFAGRLMTNAAQNEFVPISRAYGFLWLFIAGMPWAGLGACMLAWCGAERPANAWRIAMRWTLRFACGFAGVVIAKHLLDTYPEMFHPLYKSIAAKYEDLENNPSLKRLLSDNRAAIAHMGMYLGFLAFEAARLHRKNVILIVTVGTVNGLGWALLQNWKWAPGLFGGDIFNWWRCWESSGGISIGVAYGIAYFLVNRKMSESEKATLEVSWASDHPRLERFGAYLGLLLGLGLSLRSGLKGWANIYLGNEEYWSHVLWLVFGPLLIIGLLWLVVRTFFVPGKEYFEDDAMPHAYAIMWLVLIVQNVCAQLVTGPKSHPGELAFSIYYLVLFAVTGWIVYRYQREKRGPVRIAQAQH
ncbi:MAG: hypothetical protein K1Y02_24880 [Candidatus Hydrogenedentes bacterium]|nr:hypothetical protein [Candidatus Hydrogenedentota bacterium]